MSQPALPHTLAIGSDHGGLVLKNAVAAHLKDAGFAVEDVGTHTMDSVDYPDFAEMVSERVLDGRADAGILVCTTGIGVSIAANRHAGIQASLVHDVETAKITREHNASNVLCLAGKTTPEATAKAIADAWLATPFAGGRHGRRVDKMNTQAHPLSILASADPATSWPLDDPRIMSEAERATLVAWVAAGAPEGDPETAPEIAPPENPLGPPSHRFDIGVDYEPREDRTDDYRCFVIDPGLSEDAEVRMFDIQPGDAKIYHHGILHLITPDQLEDIRRLDAADPGPGYSCFGGPGLARSPWIATKTPGQAPMANPAGTAIRLPAGSVMVLQNHYNTLYGSGRDRTRVDLWISPEPVGREPRLPKLANLSFRIPAGSPAYTATASARVGLIGEARPGLVWQAWPHMHLLGSRFSFDVKRRDGTTVRLLDIPAWDFNWQGGYNFATPFELKTGDEIIMTCVWDNSPANQAFVGGQQQPPREVRWGEGSLDEMCLGGLTIVDP